jgi:hypothetical protein
MIRMQWRRLIGAATLITTVLVAAQAAPQTAKADEVVLIGAADIANCSSNADELTAAVINKISGIVFTAGDNIYPNGSQANWENCWEPSWGTIDIERIRPIPGNHDYERAGDPPYYFTQFEEVFKNILPEGSKGWYYFDAAGWRVIMLNSMEPDRAGTPQNLFLRAALDTYPGQCLIAMWHHPRFSTGAYGTTSRMKTSFGLLYNRGVSLLISGDAHHYERFAPLDPNGKVQPGRGVRQFIIGTGGAYLTKLGPQTNASEARANDSHGVLKLTLQPGTYAWEFIPVDGGMYTDTGSAACSTR